jgi:hypothetical protein
MPHKLLFLDVESYYDSEYSLSKLTPPEYILDPRWETIGCAAAVGGENFTFIDGPDLAKYLSSFDPENTTTVTFNALFDNCVFAWRYGFIPARILCAMRMAVALRGHTLPGHSLRVVSRSLKLGAKGTEIENARGKHRVDLMADPGQWRAYQAYACQDGSLCRSIFLTLAPEFPSSERRVMDLVLRCAVQPRFQIDRQMLAGHLQDLADAKVQALAAAGVSDASELRSNPKFEALLQSHGVDIEYKISPTGARIPAFAKTDEFMEHLLGHDDPVVAALAGARLGARSTIEETRGARIMAISSLNWPKQWVSGTMPIPLNYSAAHTHRLGGTWKINMQNLPAGRGKSTSKLKKALIVAPDEEVVKADLSQIECRINAWLCGQHDLLALFANKKDPYSVLASSIFGYSVDKNLHKIERFIGKGGELGLGFGCGDDKFYNMVLRQARTLGMDMKALGQIWTPSLAHKSVFTYRQTHYAICSAWRTLDTILRTAWIGVSAPVRWGPVEIGDGYVLLPNNMKMLYDVVKPVDTNDLRYRYGKSETYIYGAKFLENIVQALARIVIFNAALRIADRGYKFAHQCHDELVFVVKKADVARCRQIVMEEMRRRPSWGKDIPLDAEDGAGPSYGDAKT